MLTIESRFGMTMAVSLMKYVVGKEIFCSLSGQSLDYRTATFVETQSDGTYAYGEFMTPDKWGEVVIEMEKNGIPIARIYNLKSLKAEAEK